MSNSRYDDWQMGIEIEDDGTHRIVSHINRGEKNSTDNKEKPAQENVGFIAKIKRIFFSSKHK